MPIPDWNTLLANWWGGDGQLSASLKAGVASNVIVGDNPLYQVSDFLAIYPKFGTDTQEINALALNIGGAGYSLNDTLALVQDDAAGATITVTAISGSGAITAFTLATTGSGYRVANGLVVTGGTGLGALFNITSLTPPVTIIPIPVLQMYINLASASLSQARWLDLWKMGMSLFVAHYATLYLRSEGNVGTTAGQIAASGLEKGILIQKSAGDVSVGSKPMLDDLEGFGSWTLTAYGSQLATHARIVGMGGMYIYG